MKQKSIPVDYYTLTIYVCALGRNKLFGDLIQVYRDEIENPENFAKIQENQKLKEQARTKARLRVGNEGSSDGKPHLFASFLKQFSEVHSAENSEYFSRCWTSLKRKLV